MKNWVCLAWWQTDVTTKSWAFTYFTYKGDLYYVDAWGKIYDDEWTEVCDTWVTHTTAPHGIEFWANVYIVWNWWVVKVDSTWTATDLTSTFPTYEWTWYRYNWNCVLNYANTFLLIWDMNVVWKMDLVLWVEIFKGIRYFESSYLVFWLTQEWNYLKIYTSNKINTKIHYAKGTFDVEYTWLIQTVSLKWLALNTGDVASDQWYDYAIFKTWEDSDWTWEYKLSKIQWYSKVDIRWTETFGWEKIFTGDNPNIKSADWVLFAAMKDWIRTFTEYNGWLWWGCCEFPLASNEAVWDMFKYGEYLYVCVYNTSTDTFTERYYDMSFHPATYQPSGFVIGRVFDWGCAGLFKKNDQATITYNMPVWTSMELSYRYDRSSFWYNKSNFTSIKKLEDTNECYDIVVPTTPWVDKQTWLLSMENWNDLILLENWNGIQLEELMICPFNKTWNLLEYRFDLATTNTAKTPILFEHSLTYYDYMRKYR